MTIGTTSRHLLKNIYLTTIMVVYIGESQLIILRAQMQVYP